MAKRTVTTFGKLNSQKGFKAVLQNKGQFPRVRLTIDPIGTVAKNLVSLPPSNKIQIDRFLNYSFQSSIIVPVDTFSFTFVMPDETESVRSMFTEGSLCYLELENDVLATGIIDTVEVHVDGSSGERITVTGRDLMGQLEDQNSVSILMKPFPFGKKTVLGVAQMLTEGTRINSFRQQDAPSGTHFFSTECNESKLSALQRYLESIACVAWMDGDGELVIGKPDFSQDAIGNILCSKASRTSNVLDIKASFASTQIPNIIISTFTAFDNNQDKVPKSQVFNNAAMLPQKLKRAGHQVIRTTFVSFPEGDANPSNAASLNSLSQAGGDYTALYARRMAAAENIREIQVTARVPGHQNDFGIPYGVDQVYRVLFDRANINEDMYLYQVEYSMSEDQGPTTNLYFCRLGCIVADCKAPGWQSSQFSLAFR